MSKITDLKLSNGSLELAKKPKGYVFSDKERKFLKKHNPKWHYTVKYAFYARKSYKGKYIAFIIDTMANSPRKSGVENNWNYICERDISIIEYNEMIANYGCNNRRFVVYYYRYVEQLILDDKKYYIQTPKEFVEACKKRGYTGDFQLKMELC